MIWILPYAQISITTIAVNSVNSRQWMLCMYENGSEELFESLSGTWTKTREHQTKLFYKNLQVGGNGLRQPKQH